MRRDRAPTLRPEFINLTQARPPEGLPDEQCTDHEQYPSHRRDERGKAHAPGQPGPVVAAHHGAARHERQQGIVDLSLDHVAYPTHRPHDEADE